MECYNAVPIPAEGYRIELVTKSRLNELLIFLRDHYHAEEIMSRSLRSSFVNITEEELKLIEEDEDDMIIAVFESSPCYIAIHNDTDQIVGALLTIISTRSDEEGNKATSANLFSSNSLKSTFAKLYYNYLAKIDKEASVFDKYPDAQAALEIFALVVHKEHRNKGLAKDLCRTGMTVAKVLPQIGVAFGVYTSIYSQKVAERIGMKTILSFDLENDFKDDNGELVFRNTKPHNIVSVMAVEVDHPN